MTLKEFVAAVSGFAGLQHPDKIIHFAWFVHSHGGKERFDQGAIRNCYKQLGIPEPNYSEQFTRLREKKPKVVLKDADGYRLEYSTKAKLDEKYGAHESTIAVSKLLRELPGKISDQAEQLFLSEAITCYHNRAFRAAIVMVWNLAYDHLLNWILADAGRLASFKANIEKRIGQKRTGAIFIKQREDFEDLKEAEVLDICSTAGHFASSNTKKLLDMQLTKRNMAAHPSLVTIGSPEVEESISTLITNVVLILK
jgi:hypothetical protein